MLDATGCFIRVYFIILLLGAETLCRQQLPHGSKSNWKDERGLRIQQICAEGRG